MSLCVCVCLSVCACVRACVPCVRATQEWGGGGAGGGARGRESARVIMLTEFRKEIKGCHSRNKTVSGDGLAMSF